MNIVFFGSSEFVLPILSSIVDAQNQSFASVLMRQHAELGSSLKSNISHPQNLAHINLQDCLLDLPDLDSPINLQLVVTQPDRLHRNKLISNPVSAYAKSHSLPVYTPQKINHQVDTYRNLAAGADLAIVASFGQIVSKSILEVPKYGCINWHPSILPKHRGATPMQTAIAQGDTHTGLSWIQMIGKMDAGDLLLQLQTKLHPDTNFPSLAGSMGEWGSKTWALAGFLRILSQIKSSPSHRSDILPLPQDDTLASFTNLLSKDDRFVDPKTLTAEQIYRHYLAYIQFPGTGLLCQDHFTREIKLVSVQPPVELPASDQILYNQGIWLQVKSGKQNLTYLRTLHGLLPVSKIRLDTGKEIDLQGYLFT